MSLKGRTGPPTRRSTDPPVTGPGVAVEPAVDAVRRRLGDLTPSVAIVLGSGLGEVAEAVAGAIRVPYREIPGFGIPGAPGHRGELVAGRLDGMPVLLQSGRFHLYEGFDPAVVALPVRVFAELGVRTLIVTNAAGGMRPTFRPPVLMLIADHINAMWRSPLLGPVAPGEERFPDMSSPYDPDLRALARRVARDEGIGLEEGVYAAVLGPSYETPVEVRMLRQIGGDAVGMSTVPEVIVARARGLRVLGISTISNPGAGLADAPLDHDEVLAAAATVARDLETLVRGVVRELGRH